MFKNKIFNRVLLTGSFIITLLIIAKLFGVLQYAYVPQGGGEPNIKRKSFVFITNILPYEKYKLLTYNQNTKEFGKGVYVQRLVGVEGDKIQIKNGDLIVNGEFVDSKFKLSRSYKIDRAFVNELMLNGVSENECYQIEEDYFIAQLSKDKLNDNFFYEKFINSNPDPEIVKIYHKNWNADNFGPITVPPGKVFFLGDNRNASLDSRYTGFVDVEEITGRVIYPKN
ncbi:signal peptidase I [Chryseobacterium oryctis]|uniref:Signal peptidase I n=1 Tax=Chryseobacterium oryctis TaxID=2952618 RepID=A0ABT3HNH3_9FLAO|nr:signal peptidase I [Chryseobacterium oryctis]MCW3161342.1 signal peptidase I [Chryseobacterium oryctis]